MTLPRYSFYNVNGTLKDASQIRIGVDKGDRVDVDFKYRDNLTGELYHVQATGYRTKIEIEETTNEAAI